jgi:hypothetical protein
MSIPVVCYECGDFVGVREAATLSDIADQRIRIPCPGKDKHPKSTEERTPRLFGLVERVSVMHPSGRPSSWSEYVGPRIFLLFWLALILQPEKAIIVDAEWNFWSWRDGLSGNGIGKKKTPQRA